MHVYKLKFLKLFNQSFSINFEKDNFEEQRALFCGKV